MTILLKKKAFSSIRSFPGVWNSAPAHFGQAGEGGKEKGDQRTVVTYKQISDSEAQLGRG